MALESFKKIVNSIVWVDIARLGGILWVKLEGQKNLMISI